jgi:hypothetical protein
MYASPIPLEAKPLYNVSWRQGRAAFLGGSPLRKRMAWQTWPTAPVELVELFGLCALGSWVVVVNMQCKLFVVL